MKKFSVSGSWHWDTFKFQVSSEGAAAEATIATRVAITGTRDLKNLLAAMDGLTELSDKAGESQYTAS